MMSPQYSLLAIVAVALIAGVSEALPPQKILDGQAAVAGEFPYQVQVSYRGGTCGGAIISRRHMLTAAHCVKYVKTDDIANVKVATGSVELQYNNTHAIESITPHPLYERTFNLSINDLAIITLKENITFDRFQNKVELPVGYTPGGVTANVTGWGFTDPNIEAVSLHLHKITVTTANFTDCYKSDDAENENRMFICGRATSGAGTCGGDSGGPLVSNGTLIGILSLGEKPCTNTLPDVFVQVYHYIDWIREIMSST